MGLAMNIKQSFGNNAQTSTLKEVQDTNLFIFHYFIIGAAWVEAEELKVSAYVQDRLASIKAVVVLGRSAAELPTRKLDGRHLPIFSFLIRCGDKFLHFHFVTALLNDIFGVQSRGVAVKSNIPVVFLISSLKLFHFPLGGCMCAGPFSQLLLGIDETTNDRFEKLLLEKHEVYRPGYTRVSFPYWMSKSEIDYIINSVAFVAEHGWKFLKLYRCGIIHSQRFQNDYSGITSCKLFQV